MKPLAGTAVIGVGNAFRGDDGVGWAVVALLRERAERRPPPPGTSFAVCDGEPGRLIGHWEGSALTVIVDACFPPAPCPGRTHRWCSASGAAPLAVAPGRHSTHGLGVAEALRLADVLGRAPGRLVGYAVEGADHAPGRGLSPAVARVVPWLAELIEADVARWGGGGTHPAASGRDVPPADTL
ncbi:hydrogenase maturation protease [Streptomyces sp. JJ38]|uniref:hydrogenase maturation protease n=1 Tax=Streptomyces sp. JJ38 TaxID=2738128 RepID=UPI001C595AB3|nr:hydrogenase maturation protease [Streptomyces sp. JJ38]MBW1596434.1 hydrogenase maturation protease [Streptomyces sp. JJ38]